MPRRENRGRRQARRAPRRTILVYCGADRTEPDYFDELRRSSRNSAVTVKVRRHAVAPDALVRYAAAYRDRKAVFDEVWCVVDTDQFDIAAAVREAHRCGIFLAVSNPCFELWLLLHCDDCRAYCDGCAEVVRRLKRHVPTYDKTDLAFDQFAGGIHDALRRAKQLDPTGADHKQNPSTNVWQLVEQILGPDPGRAGGSQVGQAR